MLETTTSMVTHVFCDVNELAHGIAKLPTNDNRLEIVRWQDLPRRLRRVYLLDISDCPYLCAHKKVSFCPLSLISCAQHLMI